MFKIIKPCLNFFKFGKKLLDYNAIWLAVLHLACLLLAKKTAKAPGKRCMPSSLDDFFPLPRHIQDFCLHPYHLKKSFLGMFDCRFFLINFAQEHFAILQFNCSYLFWVLYVGSPVLLWGILESVFHRIIFSFLIITLFSGAFYRNMFIFLFYSTDRSSTLPILPLSPHM